MTRDHYAPLPHIQLGSLGCSVPEALRLPAVHIDSPAVLVMTDLSRVEPATVPAETLLVRAHQIMVHRGVRMLFVTGPDRALEGILTANDILGERPVLAARERSIAADQLRVADVMSPLPDLQAIPMPSVQRAEVGHIVATLKSAGRQHAIVVEPGVDGRQQVRGIFSLTQIARQLGVTINTAEVARNFAEIEAVIAGL
jgi:CBS-domain-containing membrane protein